MKKLLLTLAVLCGTVSGWAENGTILNGSVKLSNAPQNGEWDPNSVFYTIRNSKGSYINSDVTIGDGKLTLNNSSAQPAKDGAGYWCVVGDETNGYSFYNYKTKKILTMSPKNTSEADSYAWLEDPDIAPGENETKFEFVEVDNNRWCIKVKGTDRNYMVQHGAHSERIAYWKSDAAIYGWGNSSGTAGDDGSAFKFEEALDLTKTTVIFHYYENDVKVGEMSKDYKVNEEINIASVPTLDFYKEYEFRTDGSHLATSGVTYEIECQVDFPFEPATVDAQGNIEGPWYQMVQTGDKSNNKIALTEDGGRVNFVSDNNNNNGLWAFVRVGGYKFEIYNRACPGVALTVDNPAYDHYNHGKLYVNSKIKGLTTEFIISKNEDGFNIQIPGEFIDNYYATAGNHIEGTFGFWSIADARPITAGGSRLSVTKVDNPDLMVSKAALQNRINELNAKVALAGTNPGEYKVEEMAKLPEPIAVAQAVLDANSENVAAYNNALTTLNEAIADVDLTMNPVVAGTYRIISAKTAFNGNKVMSAYSIYGGNQHAYPAWTEKVENDPLQYWVLEAAENGKFRMKAADGNYITSGNSITETATEVSFVSIGSAQFNIKLSDNNAALHCSLHNWQGYNAGPLIEYDGLVDSPSAWKIEAVTELPKFTHELTVGNAGYATLMLGFNAEIPAGVTCYTVEVEGDKAILTVVEGGVLAANTPVIVKSSDAGKYTFTATTASVTAPVANELKGTLYPKVITAAENTTYYVLSKPAAGEGEEENPVGFYQATLNKNEGAAFLNNANKVYLPVRVEPTQAVRSLSFHFGEGATAIESIESVENNAVVYDLAGRRVQNAQKGVFIVNGKVVVK